jgi:hypothetical protein
MTARKADANQAENGDNGVEGDVGNLGNRCCPRRAIPPDAPASPTT